MGGEVVTVRKLDYAGHETWRWTGRLMERGEDIRVVDAVFNAAPRDLGYLVLETTDLFHEYYYSGRWFNIFRVSAADGALKGWYCNVTKPAVFSDGEIAFVDMVLDLFVYPDGHTLVLDEAEFREKVRALYAPDDARLAEKGLGDLLRMVERRDGPFETIGTAFV